ncbi:MAG: thioredoxin fold domain-containing protein [Alphaproteobacteria bacterium]|nr:thioredoxin fold domain-containing protein [Alphaproteobacteria bacterium]
MTFARHTQRLVLAGLLCLATSAIASEPAHAGSGRPADVRWEELRPFVFGEADDDVVIFTTPSCPYCRRLMDHVPTLAKRYRVMVLPISFASHDAQRVRALACAIDQESAAGTLLLHQDILLPQEQPCDLTPVAARYQEASRRGVAAVPFVIRPDGKTTQGLRPDLEAWLARGISP